MELTLAGETLRLLDRALYWPREQTLFVADLHLGKAATMRAAGIPVPEGDNSRVLERLSQLLGQTGAARLVILGDLLHARPGVTGDLDATFREWRARHQAVAVDLTLGNHDRSAGLPPDRWGINAGEDLMLPPFVARHFPRNEAATGFTIAGHQHPGIRVPDRQNGEALRAPVFYFQENGAILPAFSDFTGLAIIRPSEGEQVVAVLGGKVLEVPSSIFGKGRRQRQSPKATGSPKQRDTFQ